MENIEKSWKIIDEYIEDKQTEYVKADNISINNVEEETVVDTDFLRGVDENIQSPEYDKYRNLLNISSEIELECVKFKDEYQLDKYSFMKWLSLIVEEIGTVSHELNNFALHNNDVNEIRTKLIKLAATIVSWLEMMNGTNPQTTSINKTEVSSDEDSSRLSPMCPGCATYLINPPKVFCDNLKHIKRYNTFKDFNVQ